MAYDDDIVAVLFDSVATRTLSVELRARQPPAQQADRGLTASPSSGYRLGYRPP